MVNEEELKWENGLWSFDMTKTLSFALFYKEKKEKLKIDFHSFNEIFIRSSYCSYH